MTPERSPECPEPGAFAAILEPPLQVPPSVAPRNTKRRLRKLLRSVVLLACILLLLRTLILEPYSVPTGSMAPALAGIHKATACPRCGYPVLVGRRDDRADSQLSQRSYAAACCPNCGCTQLNLDSVPECNGDQLLVDKTILEFRRPHRWELTVFRFPNDPAKSYIKRIVGLPGETVHIKDGDIFIDREIARKTLAQCRAAWIPVFDNNYQPQPGGWQQRWHAEPASSRTGPEGTRLRVDGTAMHKQYQWLVYTHVSVDDAAEEVITDTYGYNGSDYPLKPQPVHDFMIECDVEVVRGSGWIGLGLDDGQDTLLAELRVGPPPPRGYGTCLSDYRANDPDPIRTAPSYFLQPGRTHHVEFAFVDRRASLAVDGEQPLRPLDLPAATHRNARGLSRPVRVGTVGVEVVLHNFRLFRDVHYRSDFGRYGTNKPVRLLAGKYFALGDNSPNSDDSRFWGGVPEVNFLGKPFVVHMPTRVVYQDRWGGHWRWPDWDRMRWLH